MLSRQPSLKIFALAVLVVTVLFLWEGHKDFSLADEGYLWYGVQRVMIGEVPIRDFMAYDPGRYYYASAIMSVMNDNGIMALRFAVSFFSVFGLFVALLLIDRAQKPSNCLYIILSTITLAVWMLPRHKLFDISLSIFTIGVLAFLIQKPTRRNYFIAGLCVGLVAVFGRNHGVYGVVGSVGAIFWLNTVIEDGATKEGVIHRSIEALLIWTSGVVIGFTPIFLMLMFVPDFSAAFFESVRLQFYAGVTNFTLPVPWPWQVNFNALPINDALRSVVIGMLFIASIVFGVLSIAMITLRRFQRKQISSEFAAASFMSLPYAHFAFSRADVSHLAQGLFPLLIGCLILFSRQSSKMKWLAATSFCFISISLMHIYHPGWQCHESRYCVNIKVSGSDLMVDPVTANNVALLRKLANLYTKPDQSFIATPFWPGAYALLEKKSPLWCIYLPLTPPSRAQQQVEIWRIKNESPGFALVIDQALDGREELRFRNTSPLIYQYIVDHFDRVIDLTHPDYQIYRAR